MSSISLSSPPGTRGILVTDFDGTITNGDFFELVRKHWPLDPDPWRRALAGEIPMREALRQIFAGATGTAEEFLALCDHTGVTPDIGAAFHRLEQAGWHIVVASAGCDFYIRPILAKVGVEAEVIAHPGTFEVGRGLTMHSLEETPFAHPHFGLNKAAVVQHYLATGLPVAFAGDGTPDLEPLLLLPPRYRFATGWVADQLAQRGEPFQRFTRWPEVVESLLSVMADTRQVS